jgi:hypothetical protein
MTQQTIDIGAAANDGTGDPLRTAFSKVNSNFTELYAATYTDEMARDAIMAMLVGAGLLVETENDAGDTDTLTVNAAVAADLWAGTSTTKAVTPKAILDSAVPQTLTDGATVTPDFGAGFNFEWTIGGNRTLANPSNAKSGQSGTIKVVQDGTGSRVITYGNNWRFPGGSATGGVLSTAANAIDLISFTVGTDGKIYATLSKAFAA